MWMDPFDDAFSFPKLFSEELKMGSLVRKPLVDIRDMGKNIVVRAELPGVEKKDISLEARDNFLSISSEAKHAKKEEKKDYFYQERSFQRFFRRIPLPAEVVAGKSKAELKNGILEIILPKKTPSKDAKKIRLQVK